MCEAVCKQTKESGKHREHGVHCSHRATASLNAARWLHNGGTQRVIRVRAWIASACAAVRRVHRVKQNTAKYSLLI
jgi:hypothetical protein